MASNVRLDVPFGFGEDVDSLFREWRDAIELANNWEVDGAATFDSSPSGYSLHIPGGAGLARAVVTTAIPAAPSSSTVSNAGRATLRIRTGTTLANGTTGVKVYSDFSAVIAVGTRILIAPDGDGWMLVSADCP